MKNGMLIGAVSLLVLAVVSVVTVDLVTVKGNEVGVRESWFGGVSNDPLPPKTYFVWPWEKVQIYPTSLQVFVMNSSEDDPSEGRRNDTYLVQSKDSQDMHLSLQCQWRIDPDKVVELHKQVGPSMIEEKALRPTMLRVVKDQSTTREAIMAYSGTGLVSLQQEIEEELSSPDGELRKRGIVVDSFVVEHIKLDPEYVAEIQARQVAMQRELRAVQETKAAEAEALKAKAMAQSDLNKAVVEAERDKEVKVLAANAEAEKLVLEAKAKQEAAELEAQGILALGKATAEAERMKLSAYSEVGSETYAKIEVSKNLGNSLSGIKGYLPENMSVYTLGTNFLNAVENVVKDQK